MRSSACACRRGRSDARATAAGLTRGEAAQPQGPPPTVLKRGFLAPPPGKGEATPVSTAREPERDVRQVLLQVARTAARRVRAEQRCHAPPWEEVSESVGPKRRSCAQRISANTVQLSRQALRVACAGRRPARGMQAQQPLRQRGPLARTAAQAKQGAKRRAHAAAHGDTRALAGTDDTRIQRMQQGAGPRVAVRGCGLKNGRAPSAQPSIKHIALSASRRKSRSACKDRASVIRLTLSMQRARRKSKGATKVDAELYQLR